MIYWSWEYDIINLLNQIVFINMKQLFFFAAATMLSFTLNGQQTGQQLSVGNSDRIVTET